MYMCHVGYSRVQMQPLAMKIAVLVLLCSLASPVLGQYCFKRASVDVQTRSIRSPNYPNGTHVQTEGECCALCSNDLTCVAAVLQSDLKCWILKAYRGLEGEGGRTTFLKTRIAPNNGSYSLIVGTTDVSGAVRTSRYPSGLSVSDASGCSDACLVDPECVVAVWNQGGADRCWPLRAYTSTHPTGSRALLFPVNKPPPQPATAAPTNPPYINPGIGGPPCDGCQIP